MHFVLDSFGSCSIAQPFCSGFSFSCSEFLFSQNTKYTSDSDLFATQTISISGKDIIVFLFFIFICRFLEDKQSRYCCTICVLLFSFFLSEQIDFRSIFSGLFRHTATLTSSLSLSQGVICIESSLSCYDACFFPSSILAIAVSSGLVFPFYLSPN